MWYEINENNIINLSNLISASFIDSKTEPVPKVILLLFSFSDYTVRIEASKHDYIMLKSKLKSLWPSSSIDSKTDYKYKFSYKSKFEE